MRFSWLADQRLPWDELTRRTQDAAQLGYSGVWLSDHLIGEDGEPFLDCWTSLSALMITVPYIEFGTLVAASTLRQPAITAQMARTLMEIGRGRFVLGLGAGGSRDDHQMAEVAFPGLRERAERLDETCHLIRRLVSGPELGCGGSQRDAGGSGVASAYHVPLLIGG